MKKIILHCGMPKTGSSALQVQLAQSRETLLKHGFDYLPMGDFKQARQGRITSGNGAGLARAYLNPEHPASLASRRGELTRGAAVVFSFSELVPNERITTRARKIKVPYVESTETVCRIDKVEPARA